MRKAMIKVWIPQEIKPHAIQDTKPPFLYREVMKPVEGTGCMSSDFSTPVTFHAFMQNNYDEKCRAIAVVEMEDGTIQEVPSMYIKFVERMKVDE